VTENERLLEACKNGNLAAVAAAVADGANVNVVDVANKCPLIYACKAGHYLIVKGLLECGASPFVADLTGNTPQCYARHSGSIPTYELINSAINKACIQARQPSNRTPTPPVLRPIELDFDMCFGSQPGSMTR